MALLNTRKEQLDKLKGGMKLIENITSLSRKTNIKRYITKGITNFTKIRTRL